MTTPPTTPKQTPQPRPVITASRTLGALSLVAGVFPLVGGAFGWVDWTSDQLEAYVAASGTVIAAVALFLGVNVEKEVTPVESPRDDDLVPFVPIAVDGYDD